MLLVLAALLPMLIWATGLTMWNSIQERRVVEHGLAETVRALTTTVDQHLSLSIESLESVALSPLTGNGDYSGFRGVAERLVREHPTWVNVVLSTPDGRQFVNTLLPQGAALPHLGEPGYEPVMKTLREVQATGRAVISDLFRNPQSGQFVVLVAVPVRDEAGAVTHVLSARIRADAMSELLSSQEMNEGWLAAIVDRQMRFVARSVGHDAYVGAVALDWFKRASAAVPSGIVTGPSMEGEETTFAYERSEMSGWTIAYGAPQSEFLVSFKRSFFLTAGFGLMLLAASLGLALWVARRILKPVEALNHMAQPFVAAEKSSDGGYAITELDELYRALDGLSAALEESEARFSRLFASAPVMLDVLDPDGRIIEVNDRWLATLGYDREAVLGRRYWEFLTPDSCAYAENVVFPETLRGNRVEDLPLRFITRSRDMREIMVSSQVERERDGTVKRVVSALRDVTEQRRIEAALARAIEEAEMANDTKSRFLAAASHDLRQPLQALTLYLGVLSGRVAPSERPVMNAIGQCVDSLSSLLNDMLDVARLDAGIVEPRPADVFIGDIIARVATSWRIQAAAKNIELVTVACDSVVVRTDPALIEQVLSNLVANAVRYTEQGRVLVGCRRAGPGRARIEVWDTGIGIPHDKLSEIFEEFRQLGNPERRRDKGTGLGLAIVDRITRLLGHELTVRSELAKGSVFAITLPTAGATAAAISPLGSRLDRNGAGRRILVVEDEVHVRSALELVLTELGHHVEVADAVDQALERMDRFCPDLVIADYRLSAGATGIDVIRALRARCGDDLAAVVLTGDTDPAVIRRIVGEGMHLLHKPLQIEALQGFLKQVA